jgi:hypothetical protein
MMKKSRDGKGSRLYRKLPSQNLLLLQISEKERKRAKMVDQITLLMGAGVIGMITLMLIAYFTR